MTEEPEYLKVSRKAVAELKAIHVASGTTQRDLADIVGMSQGALNNFLQHRADTWQIRTMVRIASALGVRVKISFEPKR